MTRRIIEAVVVHAVGGFVGALTALELGVWWYVGGFAGVLASGIMWGSMNYRLVAGEVSSAWRTATTWRPDVELWKCRSLSITALIVPSYSLLLCFFIPSYEGHIGWAELSFWMAFVTFIGVVVGLLTSSSQSVHEHQRLMSLYKTMILYTNPVALPFFLLYLVYKLIVMVGRDVVEAVPRIVRTLPRFGKRLLLRVDASAVSMSALAIFLATGTGYLFGMAWVGALVGGGLCFIWLKLVRTRLYAHAG